MVDVVSSVPSRFLRRPRADQLTDGMLSVTPTYLRTDLVVITLCGEIDLCTELALRRTLTVHQHVPRVVLDLTQVEFCGVAGARSLHTAAAAARAVGHCLVIVESHAVRRVLDVTGLAESVPRCACLSDALCTLLPAGAPLVAEGE